MQLATKEHVYILDVPAIFEDARAKQTAKAGLEKVFNNANITIVGYQVSEDIRRTARVFQLEASIVKKVRIIP